MDITPLKFLDYIRTIIRYVSSGIVALLALHLVLADTIVACMEVPFGKSMWYFLTVASVIGFITYSYHIAFMDHGFLIRSLKTLIKKDPVSKENICKIYTKFKDPEIDVNAQDAVLLNIDAPEIKFDGDFVLYLFDFEYERSGTKITRYMVINRKMAEIYNMMAFAYCCSYIVIAVLLVGLLIRGYLYLTDLLTAQWDFAFTVKCVVVAAFAYFLHWLGRKLDILNTKRQLRFIMKYQIDGSDVLYPKNDKSSNPDNDPDDLA